MATDYRLIGLFEHYARRILESSAVRAGGREETMREEVRISELICHGEPWRAGHESFSRLSSPWIIVHSKWSQTIEPKETAV